MLVEEMNDNVLMCQCASVPMICSLRRGGAKRLLLTAEIKHESHIKHDSQLTGNDPEGVKFPYKKRYNDNPQPCRG